MNKLINRVFPLIPVVACFCPCLFAFESHNTIEIASGLNLKISCEGQAIKGGKINIKIVALSDSSKKLENINIDLLINRNMFRFIKKNFEFSDIFKVKTEKLDDNLLKINFSLKNKKEILLLENSENELMNFDLNIKKKILQEDSNLDFKFNIDNLEKEFSEYISLSSKVKSIEIENNNFNFDENIKNYNLTVPSEDKYLDLKIYKIVDGIEEYEDKHIKLKKSGSVTHLKIGEYEIEVYRLEKEDKKLKENKYSEVSKCERKNNKEKKSSNRVVSKKSKTRKSIKMPEKLDSKKDTIIKKDTKNIENYELKSKNKVKTKEEKNRKKMKVQKVYDNNYDGNNYGDNNNDYDDGFDYNYDNDIDSENKIINKEDKVYKEEIKSDNENKDKFKIGISCALVSFVLVLLGMNFKKIRNFRKKSKIDDYEDENIEK